MNIQIEHAPWDSSFFQCKIGIVHIAADTSVTTEMLSEIINKASRFQYKTIYIMLQHDNIIDNRMLNPFNNCITLVDKKRIYTKAINSTDHFSYSSIQSFKSAQIPEELYSLALESGKHSRFKIDTHFPKGAFALLYKTWIERSVNNDIADDVLVHYENNKIEGFLSYKINKSVCTIGLIAVSPACQGTGIGSKLIDYLEREMSEQGVLTIDVATQSENIQACTFYEKKRFQISTITNIYHLWL